MRTIDRMYNDYKANRAELGEDNFSIKKTNCLYHVLTSTWIYELAEEYEKAEGYKLINEHELVAGYKLIVPYGKRRAMFAPLDYRDENNVVLYFDKDGKFDHFVVTDLWMATSDRGTRSLQSYTTKEELDKVLKGDKLVTSDIIELGEMMIKYVTTNDEEVLQNLKEGMKKFMVS